jgi:hypothetical protein
MRMRMYIAAAVSLATATLAMGQVTGTVKFDGKAPAMTPIDMSAKLECAAQHKDQPVFDESVVVSKDGGVKNVVISVKFDKGATWDRPKNPNPKDALLDQKGCQFFPHVLALEKGGRIIVQNSDPFVHNVHTQPDKNPADNVVTPDVEPGKPLSVLTDPEYFHIKCDVQNWMSCYAAVLDNPYFAVTDENGHFTLPTGLRAGQYKVHAWHEKLGEQDGDLTVSATGLGTLNFTFKPEGAKLPRSRQ